MHETATILIASNVAADAELAANCLRGEFKDVFVSCSADTAAADFEACRPDVLVLAFRPVQDAERNYRALYSSQPQIQEHRCRTIVLCQNDEVRSAYELCAAGRFDDYMQFWPMTFDSLRLPMGVVHAMRQLRLARETGLTSQIAARSLQAAEIDPVVKDNMARGAQLIQLASEAMERLDREVSAVLDRLPQGLSERSATAQVKDAAGLRADIDLLAGKEIHARLQSLAGNVAPLGRWVAEFRQQCEPHLQAIRALRELAQPARASVLLVEDDELQQKLLRRMLARENVDCEVAADGAAAMAAVRQRRPDLILLDIGLPDIGGIELLRRLQANPLLASVPKIMLTGSSDKHSVVESRRAGAVDFMVKPVSSEKLREKLHRFLQRSDACNRTPGAAAEPD